MSRRRRNCSKGRAYHLIKETLRETPGFSDGVDVDGELRTLSGLYHNNFSFRVDDPGARSDLLERSYVIRLPRTQHDWQCGLEAMKRLADESETLKRLEEIPFEPLVPRVVADVYEDGEFAGFIETFVPGMPLEGRKDEKVISSLGYAAARVHELDPEQLPHLESATRRSHVLEELGSISSQVFNEFQVAVQARTIIEENLPVDMPGSVIHGDLLPQNVLQVLEDDCRDEFRVGIIDWEMAKVGDPAYDLAIVSRANRKIAGVNNGRTILCQAYADAGGKEVTEINVLVHEMFLVMGWIEQTLTEEERSGHGVEYYAGKLKALIRHYGHLAG